MSIFKQRLILFYLLLSILFISYWSYSSVYYTDSNSLKYNYALLFLLIPTFFFDFNGFLNYIINSKYARIFLLFIIFLFFDLLINYPLNKYKIDTYVLIWVIIVFSYLLKSIHYKRFTKFLYFILLVWFSFSIFELYILNQYPILHFNAFEGIGVQNIFSWEENYHGWGVHGLGITSQVNTSALILFIFFSVYYFLQRNSIIIKFFHLILILLSLYVLQFSSSLTGLISIAVGIYFYLIARNTKLSIGYAYIYLFIAGTIFSALIFVIGNYLGFSAKTGTEEAYYYDLFQWPLEYLVSNFIIVISGFQNYIPAEITPLENRYFNLLLSLGIIFFTYSIYLLYKFHRKIFLEANNSIENRLKLFIYTYLIFSYFHISYIPHTNGIILFALLFVFCVTLLKQFKIN